MRVPGQYAPRGLASAIAPLGMSDEQKLDVALAQWAGPWGGFGGMGPRPPYAPGAAPGAAGPGMMPGMGWWAGGWWWWLLAFTLIWGLVFLW